MSPSNLVKILCSYRPNGLVKPSAEFCFVGIHWSCSLPCSTSYRSQNWWISICRSFVLTTGWLACRRRSVCLLSQDIESGCSGLKRSRRNTLSSARTSLAVWDRDSSSALVVEVVTVACFVDCHIIGLLKSLIRKPCVLRLVARQSAKDASDAVRIGSCFDLT